MHEKHHNYLVGIISAALVIGASLWYFNTNQTNQPYVAPQAIPTVPVQKDVVYENQQYGFSLSYSKVFKLIENEENINAAWSYNSSYKGTRIVALRLPKDFQPKTNFSEGIISIGVTSDLKALKQCVTAQNGEKEVLTTVDGNGFHIFTSTDAGAGNFYQTTSYRSIRGKTCFALEQIIHSTNIGNYDPSQGIREFDRNAIEKILETVTTSFKFTN